MGYEAGTASSLGSARYPCCGSCLCHHTRLPWQPALWPSGFYIRAYLGEAAFPPPGARLPIAGNSGTPGKGPGGRSTTYREVGTPVESPIHLCDMSSSRAETRRTQGHPVPRGGFHKAGEGPAFGDSFPSFSSLRKGAQRSVPGGGAGLQLRNRRRTSPPQPGGYPPASPREAFPAERPT